MIMLLLQRQITVTNRTTDRLRSLQRNLAVVRTSKDRDEAGHGVWRTEVPIGCRGRDPEREAPKCRAVSFISLQTATEFAQFCTVAASDHAPAREHLSISSDLDNLTVLHLCRAVLSMTNPSVRPFVKRVNYDKTTETSAQNSYTTQKCDASSFPTGRMVGAGRPLYLKF